MSRQRQYQKNTKKDRNGQNGQNWTEKDTNGQKKEINGNATVGGLVKKYDNFYEEPL